MIENQSLTVEETQALFFDEAALIEPARKLYRLNNHSGGRHYYRFTPEGVRFYVSVTTMLQQTMPTSPHLIKWIASMGADEAEAYKEERAGYGSFMHMQFERLLIARTLDLDALDDELKQYCIENRYTGGQYEKWLHEMKKDILGFAQFLIDYSVKPLAIEIMLCSDKYGYAGALDLVCEMLVEEMGFFGEVYKTGAQAGQPKKTKGIVPVRAIVDFKSGRKGFYENHEIQLEAYKQMFEENYPEKPIHRIYNYGPTDWRTAPGYKLCDQTDSKNRQKLEHLCNIAAIEASKREKYITSLTGVIRLDDGYIGDNVEIRTLEEFVTRKTEKINGNNGQN